ncbi:MAG: hypothetical protein OER93_01095, partial [Thermoleophilia bacterium]|nr:hypothetical protein [Thermoleophilia bacterium]
MTRNAWFVVIGFIVAVGLIVVIALDDNGSSDDPEPATVELTDTQLLAVSIATAGSDVTQAIQNASGGRPITAADIERLQAEEQARARARQRYLQELVAVARAFGTLGGAAADADNAEALAARNAELRSARAEISRAVGAAAAA